MNYEQKYRFVKAPKWANGLSNEELVIISTDDAKTSDVKKSGKGVCYVSRQITNTSNVRTDSYSLSVYGLHTSELLQAGSVREFIVRDSEHVEIHRVSIVRDGILIDKKESLNIRVLDDEKASQYGSISKLKKVHCIVNDLRLNDVLIFEYTVASVFDKENFLDKKYYRGFGNIPVGYWFYKKFTWEFIQNRDEDISIVKRYFRDEKGERISEKASVVKKGEIFKYEEKDFQKDYHEDIYNPYIEVATDSTWQQISSYLTSLYKDKLIDTDLRNSHIYDFLKLADKFEDIENKIQRIIEYVQNNIVYLYDAEVMHGHIPQPSSKTLELKSGDCKAKSLLLINLFNTIGIKSDFILVNYSADYYIPESMPSPFLFNHAIVRVSHKGQEYFVDPTWSDRFGILENRSEPFFANFLVVSKNSDIENRKRRAVGDINIEQKIDVKLHGDEGVIKIDSIFRRESADAVRANFKKQDRTQLLQKQNKEVLSSFQYTEERDPSSIFKETNFKIVSDDIRDNVLKTSYESKLIKPYADSKIKGRKIFKFYYQLNIDHIRNFHHKDRLCDSFCSYSSKDQIIIESDLLINKLDQVTTRETEIDNDYFTFFNKKSVSSKKIEVNAEFAPKTYGYIKEGDLESVKKDYVKINDSNYGVGLIFQSTWQFINHSGSYYLRYGLILLVAIGFIFRIFTQDYGSTQNVTSTMVQGSATSPVSTALTEKYTDPKYGFTIQYPQGWEVSPEAVGLLYSVYFIAPDTYNQSGHLRGSVVVNVFPDSSSNNLDNMTIAFRQEVRTEAENSGDQWTIISETDRISFLEFLANKYITTKLRTFDGGKTYIKQKSKIYQFVKGQWGYDVEYKNDIDKYDAVEPLGDKILNTLKIN